MNGEDNTLSLEKILKISIPAIDNFIEVKKRIILELKMIGSNYPESTNERHEVYRNIITNEKLLNDYIKLKKLYDSLLEALHQKKKIALVTKDEKYLLKVDE